MNSVNKIEIESSFITKAGYPAIVLFRQIMACRFGYVAVPKGHKAIKVSDDVIDEISVHGGVTARDYNSSYKLFRSSDEMYYIFWFDCGHVYDKQDFQKSLNMCDTEEERNKLSKIFELKFGYELISKDEVIRDVKYVESQCELLAEQLKKIDEEK